MAVETLIYPAFADLDGGRLDALSELLAAVVSEYNADIDLRRGVVRDLVLHPRALLTAVMEQAVVDALNAGSLEAIVADPASATEAAVDRVLGNYGLTRRAGAAAAGTVTIVLDSLTAAVIPSGTKFTISGRTFATDQVYAARTSQGQVTGPGDRLLTPVDASDYAFTVGVKAAEVGQAGNVRRGATATPAVTILEFVKAYAAADFTGGADAETNAELASRQQSGLAAKAWSNRPSIHAAILDHATTVNGVVVKPFAGTKATSVTGFGDAEMLRDQHSLIPFSGGGRADLYAQTDATYQTLKLTKTASLISKVGAVGTWQFSLGRDDAPGFYEVTKVLLPTSDQSASGFPVATDVRGTDLTGAGWKPQIPAAVEGVYSAYQTSVFTFVDTVTNATALAINSTKAYDVLVRAMPLIKDLQAFWNDAGRRPPMGDVLVKAPVPCFTSLSFTLVVPPGTTVDTAAVASAMAAEVNASNFSGKLSMSVLSRSLHDLVPTLAGVSGASMTGRIRKPNGTATHLSDATTLTIPEDPANLTSPRTVAFLTEASAIAISVVVDTVVN